MIRQVFAFVHRTRSIEIVAVCVHICGAVLSLS